MVFAIRGARLFDGTGPLLVERPVVLADDGRIVAVRSDGFKVMATGGEMTPGTHSHVPQYTVDELRAAAEEAHRLGLPITAHAHGGAGIANVAAAGFDSVEHCSFITETGEGYIALGDGEFVSFG